MEPINTKRPKSNLAALHHVGITHREFSMDVRSRYALSANVFGRLYAAVKGLEGVCGCLIYWRFWRLGAPTPVGRPTAMVTLVSQTC